MDHKNIYYTIDLFAGCGGLSEGFHMVNFDTVAQVEMDRWACETLKTRLLYHEIKKINKIHHYNKYVRDEITIESLFYEFPEIIRKIESIVIKARFGEDDFSDIVEKIEYSKHINKSKKIHVLLGGPPCQPYSLIGRSRDPDRMQKDNRHYLYSHYLRILEYIKPDFFLYENVPGLFSARANGESIFKKLLNDFSELNPPYEIIPPLEKVREKPSSYVLDSANFGVPQHRKRLILIGFKKNLKARLPEVEEIFGILQKRSLRNMKNKRYVTVYDAISDLPKIRPGEGSDSWYGPYENKGYLTKYQKIMRKSSIGVINHRARTHIGGDLDRYRFFIEHRYNGNGRVNLEDLLEMRPDLKPDHKHLDKFLDRFNVQWFDRPSSTITAHISKDGHYFIHPDINQLRSFTVREAARCQSFPDNFKFEGPRTHQYRQVGNAVPPLLAKEIAKLIIKQLNMLYAK